MDHLLRATARAQARHFWFRGFRAFVAPLLRRATAEVASPRILDCGCGTGANLVFLEQFGRAYGFDLSRVGLQFARGAGPTRVARASVTAAPFPSGAFDLVTSFDVLYALEDCDERKAIGEMWRLLKPGGYAVINVAALEMLRGDHSVLSHEVRRYTKRTLRTSVAAAGFHVIRLTYTNVATTPPLAVWRTFQRWRGLRAEAAAQQDISVPPALLNALLTAIVLAESVWLRRFDAPFGSSLLCLARKPVESHT